MSINYIDDSDGVTHQVWAQRQASSCAVASIWMARNQALQSTSEESEWELAWQLYNGVVRGMNVVPEAPSPMSLSQPGHRNDQSSFGAMFANAGTFMGQIAKMLENDGLRIVQNTPFMRGTVVDTSQLSDTTPAIVLLGWYAGANRRGGHFIVASRITNSAKIVYLDPWKGVLQELGVGPKYNVSGEFEQVLYISK